MIRQIVIIFILFSSASWGNPWDLTAGFQGRTYPSIGALTFGEIGHNILLWDKRSGDKKDLWKFGLFRPYIFGGSSVVINQIEGGVDFYPISLLSIGAGRRYDRSDFEFGFFDCDTTVECKNSYERNFVRAKLVAGYKGFVTFHVLRKENIIPDKTVRRFGEYTHVVHGDADGDQLTTLQSFLGYREDEKMYGLLYLKAKMKETNHYSNGIFGVHQLPVWDNWKLMVGLGAFQSSVKGNGSKVIFRLHRSFWDGIKLF